MALKRNRPPQLRIWVMLLAITEAAGMTTAAAAAHVGQAVLPDPQGAGQVAGAVGLATAGGIVEGVAVGLATGYLVNRLVGQLSVRTWIGVTTAVAGLGWAAGTVPSALSTPDASQPPALVILAGALGMGAVLGGLLGSAQALVLRGRVAHPGRWIGANVLAWSPTMTIIFAGATAPDESWPVVAVLALAVVTGLVAGATLGLILGWSASSLTGSSTVGRFLLAVMTTRWRRHIVPAGMIGLKVRGNVTGEWHSLVVMGAQNGGSTVVFPGNPSRKRWWRNLAQSARVQFLRAGDWRPADAWVLRPQDHEYPTSLDAYRRRYPRVQIPVAAPLVLIVPRPGEAATSEAQSVVNRDVVT